MDLLHQFRQELARSPLSAERSPLLVGVSGGIDSMVLLHLLLAIVPEHPFRLAVAHFDHQLRGPDSTADAEFVRGYCQDNNLPFFTERGDVRACSDRDGISIEMAARKLRHAFFANAAQTFGASTVCLAHHADDQIELFWLRLLRGNAGLGGMQPLSSSPVSPNLRIARPLLQFRKADLEAYAQAHSIPYRKDSSNELADPLRNRIRLQLLPSLKQLQTGIDEITLRLADITAAEKDFIRSAAQEWLRDSSPPFSSLPPALQREVVRFQFLTAGITPESNWIEKLREGAVVTICSGIQGALRDGILELREPLDQARFSEDSVRLDLAHPGQAIWNGLMVRWSEVAEPRFGPGNEFFDASALGRFVTLRHWKRGDLFHPIGMPGPSKVQDLFVNAKIPRELRHRLGVAVAASGEVFWVEGLRISERHKLTAGTPRICRWEWERLQ